CRLLLAAAPAARAAPRLLLRLRLLGSVVRGRHFLFGHWLLGRGFDRFGLSLLLRTGRRFSRPLCRRFPCWLLRLALGRDRLGFGLRLRDEGRVGGPVDEPLDADPHRLADHSRRVADADRVAVARSPPSAEAVISD